MNEALRRLIHAFLERFDMLRGVVARPRRDSPASAAPDGHAEAPWRELSLSIWP